MNINNITDSETDSETTNETDSETDSNEELIISNQRNISPYNRFYKYT